MLDLLMFVDVKDLLSLGRSYEGESYVMAVSPAIVTRFFRVLFGFFVNEIDFLSIHFKLEKLSFYYSFRSSLELLF